MSIHDHHDFSSTMPFGKYAGETLGSIAQEDPQYLGWLCEQDWLQEKFSDLRDEVLELLDDLL